MSARSAASIATQSAVLLIVRLAFAGLLLGRFWWRWQIEGVPAQVARLSQYGVPQPELVAWGTLLLEGLGGGMLALGLLTRLIGGLVATENIIIIVLRWSQGLYANHGGFEYNVALAALGLVFLVFGASYTGLDTVFFRRGRTAKDADQGADLYQPKLGSTAP